jgi:hypothetical protein
MLVDEIQKGFNFGDYTCNEIKDSLVKNMAKVFGSYKDSDSLIILLEENDLFGKDCLFYIANYELSVIFNQQIFDSYINKKWNGRVEIDGHIDDFSI